jgi:hypothetical protein
VSCGLAGLTSAAGFASLADPEKTEIRKLIDEFTEEYEKKLKGKPTSKPKAKPAALPVSNVLNAAPPAANGDTPPASPSYQPTGTGADAAFEAFTSLCDRIAAEPSHTGKTKLIRQFIERGSDGHKFTGVCC